MQTRRNFIKNSAVLSAGILTVPAFPVVFSSLSGTPEIGLQLYTVRDAMGKDPAGTLARVAQIGYNSVESAIYSGTEKYYGMDPQTFAALLKQNGLVMPSGHFRLGEEGVNGSPLQGTLLHDWDRAIEDAHAVGLRYMVCSWLSPAERLGLDHYKQLAGEFNTAAEKCKKADIQFCYHNHDFEFEAQDGKYPYDVLLDNTDPDLVKLEIDMYWVSKAGLDPVALINKHPGRFPLWHLKDMDNTPAKMFTEVGNGVVDFKRIFTVAATAGLKHFFVEQDECPGSPFDSIAQSIAYIKKNLV